MVLLPRAAPYARWPEISRTIARADIAGMARKPVPPKLIGWNVYKVGSKAVLLGEVEAPDEAAAMEKAAGEFKVPADRADTDR